MSVCGEVGDAGNQSGFVIGGIRRQAVLQGRAPVCPRYAHSNPAKDSVAALQVELAVLKRVVE